MNIIKFNKKQIIFLTHKCNNNCISCKYSNENQSRKDVHKALNDIFEDIYISNEALITGNEPTLRDDFFEILETAKKNKIELTIKSNGRLFSYPNFADKIGDEKIIVELKSHEQKKHDEITKAQDSYLQAIKGIKNLVKRGIDTTLKFDIDNSTDIKPLIDLAADLNIKKIALEYIENIENNERIESMKTGLKYAEEEGISLFFINETKNIRILSIINQNVKIGPEILEIDLCDSCNLKCNYCWDHSPLLKEETKPCSQETDIVIKAIRNAPRIGVDSIGFAGGGEPFLHKNISKIINCITEEKLGLNILTNGTLLSKEMITNLAQNGVSLRINISAGKKDTYLKIHNTNNETYEKLIENLKTISNNYRNNGKIDSIDILFVINKDNFKELEDMIDLVIDNKFKKARFTLMTPTEETKDMILNNSEILEYKKSLQAINNKAKENCISTNIIDIEDSIENMYKGIYDESQGCYWNYFFTRIQMDGTINMCGELPVEELNIKNNSLIKIFNSKALTNLRERLKKSDFPNNPELKCKCCNDFDSNVNIKNKLKKYNLI